MSQDKEDRIFSSWDIIKILFYLLIGFWFIYSPFRFWTQGRGWCTYQEDVYTDEDGIKCLKSTGEKFTGVWCNFGGDYKYVDGVSIGYESSFYQHDDYDSWYEIFYYNFIKTWFSESEGRKWRVNVNQGKYHGEYKAWDKYGNLTSSTFYSNGKRNGTSRKLVNGKWKTEEYQNGVLVNNISDEVKKDTQENIEKLDDAVVLIEIYDYFGDYLGHGSGFIIDKYGTVVTNYHVVDGAYKMKVVIEKNGFKTKYDVQKIISGSKSKDLAKIAIKRNNSEFFSYLNLAKNYPTKGDDCWSISTPFERDYMNTVSKGLISNLQSDRHPKKIQHTAEITKGSSGGPLLNSLSEVIGVVSGGIATPEGYRASLNFAISIGELNNLPSINKKNIVDPNSIPCKIAFYTDDKTAGDLHFFVDGLYLGSFDTYFTNRQPSCGDVGTITKVLYTGNHKYEMYNKTTGKSTYGSVFLEPGDCQIYKVWHN